MLFSALKSKSPLMIWRIPYYRRKNQKCREVAEPLNPRLAKPQASALGPPPVLTGRPPIHLGLSRDSTFPPSAGEGCAVPHKRLGLGKLVF